MYVMKYVAMNGLCVSKLGTFAIMHGEVKGQSVCFSVVENHHVASIDAFILATATNCIRLSTATYYVSCKTGQKFTKLTVWVIAMDQ